MTPLVASGLVRKVRISYGAPEASASVCPSGSTSPVLGVAAVRAEGEDTTGVPLDTSIRTSVDGLSPLSKPKITLGSVGLVKRSGQKLSEEIDACFVIAPEPGSTDTSRGEGVVGLRPVSRPMSRLGSVGLACRTGQ